LYLTLIKEVIIVEIRRYLTISGDDIRDDKADRDIQNIVDGVLSDGDARTWLLEHGTADPYDLGKLSPEDTELAVYASVERAYKRAWCEFEIVIKL
jgi:hypothetical protein